MAKETTYRPFGEAVDFTTNLTPSETKGFLGERYDTDAGLQYLNARYYDPALAMFIQPDWFEVTKAGVGTNRYAYSFNDPVNLSDPNGNAACGGICVVAAAIGAWLGGVEPANAPGPDDKIVHQSDGETARNMVAGATVGWMAGNAIKRGAAACLNGPACKTEAPRPNTDEKGSIIPPDDRPTWQQSEIDVEAEVGGDFKAQVSYKDGVEVPYGTKGSARPDLSNGCDTCIEVKNYDLSTKSGITRLVNVVSTQARTRAQQLPDGMEQNVVVDIRGQSVGPKLRMEIKNGILSKAGEVISSIRFKD